MRGYDRLLTLGRLAPTYADSHTVLTCLLAAVRDGKELNDIAPVFGHCSMLRSLSLFFNSS
jgi:hypothetical protein